MPLYDYECGTCKYSLNNVQQSIKQKPLKKCDRCGHNTLERIIHPPMVFVKQEASTIGQLSERNSKRLGKYEVQERTLRDKDLKKTALNEAKREMHSQINKMNDKQKQRYIENG